MFTIMGGDGKEYGPVSTGKILEWIAGGRANLQTRARRAGEGDWKTLAEFTEFAPPQAATVPPPLPEGGSYAAVAAAVPPAVPVTGAAPAEAVEDDEVLADRGIRFLAFLVDQFVQMLCALPGLIVLGRPIVRAIWEGIKNNTNPDIPETNGLRLLAGGGLIIALWLAQLIIQVALLSTRGQTLGKLLFRIRIVRCSHPAPAGFMHAVLLRAFVPFLIKMVPWFGFIFFITDSLFIFSDNRRCVHDLLADTKVIQVNSTAKSG
jgi:uncharacterized RDD family membrane protein YckC